MPGSYGNPNGGIVSTRCSVLNASGGLVSTLPLGEALVLDVATSADGTSVATVGAGAAVVEVDSVDGSQQMQIASRTWQPLGGQLTAVAFDGQGNVLVQARQPAALTVLPPSLDVSKASVISLSSISRDDIGHDVFHAPTSAQLACASCHPEGGDDSHVWILNGEPRRTPSLRGTIAATAPYHWTGDEADFPTLVADVLTHRMSGPTLSDPQMSALTQWVQTIPAPAAPSWIDGASAQRGKALFANAVIGCATCHSGPKLTNNLTLDVGTGQPFQVPPLVGVGWRTPLMHDGCAQTIADRFGACATTAHGMTSALTPQNVTDLSTYLESL